MQKPSRLLVSQDEEDCPARPQTLDWLRSLQFSNVVVCFLFAVFSQYFNQKFGSRALAWQIERGGIRRKRFPQLPFISQCRYFYISDTFTVIALGNAQYP